MDAYTVKAQLGESVTFTFGRLHGEPAVALFFADQPEPHVLTLAEFTMLAEAVVEAADDPDGMV